MVRKLNTSKTSQHHSPLIDHCKNNDIEVPCSEFHNIIYVSDDSFTSISEELSEKQNLQVFQGHHCQVIIFGKLWQLDCFLESYSLFGKLRTEDMMSSFYYYFRIHMKYHFDLNDLKGQSLVPKDDSPNACSILEESTEADQKITCLYIPKRKFKAQFRQNC